MGGVEDSKKGEDMRIKVVIKKGHMKIIQAILGAVQFVVLVGAYILLLVMFLLLGHPS